MEAIVYLILRLVGIYLVLGVLFSFLFFWKGKVRVDESTEGMSLATKLLLFPGMCALWIVFFPKWINQLRS